MSSINWGRVKASSCVFDSEVAPMVRFQTQPDGSLGLHSEALSASK